MNRSGRVFDNCSCIEFFIFSLRIATFISTCEETAMKVLHVASFSGNIGDNANHMGFRPWAEEQLGPLHVDWTNLEIREFFWGSRSWDKAFTDFVNEHDLLVIGGGNYFELWVENSPTGTSIAIDAKTFSRIKVPVFFNALGVDPGQGASDWAVQRFRGFLDTLLADDQYLVSVRNDGARRNLRDHIGTDYANAVHLLPDSGFFATFPPFRLSLTEPKKNRKRLFINVASDMPETRFRAFSPSNPIEDFAREVARSVTDISEALPESDFYFMPHIFRDLQTISLVVSHLPDQLRRTRVAQGPYGTGNEAAKISFGMYATGDLVLGMRFHANVCSLGMGKETIGLNSYPQIQALYHELDQPDRLVDVDHPGFNERLTDKACNILSRNSTFARSPLDAKEKVSSLRDSFASKFVHWLQTNGIT